MAKVNFIRKHTKAEVNDEPIVDGNFIVTGEGNVFIDYGTERIEIISSGGSITGDTLPIGSITAYGKETAPANWLICDGSAVSRSAYADLFAVIGTKYGEGDGSTTFNLPNLKGRVPVGLDSDDTDFNTIGKTGGEKTHTLTIDEMPSHDHGEVFPSKYGYEYPLLTKNGSGSSKNGIMPLLEISEITDFQTMAGTTGEGKSHNNLQPYEVNNFIIKAFQSAGVVAEVVNAQTESDTNVYSCNYINGIIKSGSNSNGNWIKFEDGTMITYQEIEVETACNTAWGNLFVGNYATAINFPQTFKELPKVLIDLKLKAGACFKVEWEVPIITTSSYKNIGIGRGTTSDAVGLTITLYAIGKWK